jgi:hypothetical protein
VKRKLKTKIKLKKKQNKVRSYLADVNLHCANLTTALRSLADMLDNIRSFHLDKERSS